VEVEEYGVLELWRYAVGVGCGGMELGSSRGVLHVCRRGGMELGSSGGVQM